MTVSNGGQVQPSRGAGGPGHGPRRRTGRFAVASFCLLVTLFATTATIAEPLRRPLYPQDRLLFDLILRTSDDPDLLTPRQVVLRDQYRRLGVVPGGETPSLATVFQVQAADKAEFDRFGPQRVRRERSYDFDRGLAVDLVIPEATLFRALADTNEVGVAFRIPRDYERADLRLDVSSIDAHIRAAASLALRDQWEQQVRNRTASGDAAGDLLNFTIPIKIPRTLERIIGRGEATNIRISGTEQIRIGGQSTVRNNFVGNEVQQNQSYFPQLELEQQLRVDLVGQVGEKIKVRVSHNSQAIGSESTEIRLSFEGDEDDIVQTIRAGDIDVTLPGSNLLGVGASRGGLFGLKVEGAVGPVRYTALTSKEEATQESRTFSQAGGSTTEETVVIRDIDYVRGRFFRLTAPTTRYFPELVGTPQAPSVIDNSGFYLFDPTNEFDWRIDPNSVEVYTLAGAGVSDDNTVDHGIAILDDSGIGWEGFGEGSGVAGAPLPSGLTDEQFADQLRNQYVAAGRVQVGSRWRRLSRGDANQVGFGGADWFPLLDFESGLFIGLEMARAYGDQELLAVTYDIVTGPEDAPTVVRRVGRSTTRANSTIPNLDRDGDGLGDLVGEPVTGGDAVTDVHVFKLLKPRNQNDPFNESGEADPLSLAWEYELRNFYDLRGRDIDPTSFQLRIEQNNTALEFPELEPDTRIPWIQIFGLDQNNQSDTGTPDNRPDLDEPALFNLTRGFLQFPATQPFNMSPEEIQNFSRGQIDDLDPELLAPDVYRTVVNTEQERIALNRFNIVVQQSGVSSNLRLNAFNIREGSEEIILNGRTLGPDEYDIDYFSGEVNLKGDALAELNAQSSIQVRYEQNPLFGGGRTSLSGLNLSSELWDRTQVSTTWLFQTRPNAQTKVRLGEEPKRNLVGNLNVKSRIEPEWLRPFADAISRQPVDRAPSFDVTAEIALSVPNPNTKNVGYLEDFENVDQSIQISLNRDGWWWASLPVRGRDRRTDPRANGNELGGGATRESYGPEDRAYTGWHRPASGRSLQQGQVNPELSEIEQNDLIPTLELIFRASASDETDPDETGGWRDDEYAGIMRSLGEVDLTQAQFLEFWVDAGDRPIIEGADVNPAAFARADSAFFSPRSGTLHFDFGDINEDFYWPRLDSLTYQVGSENREDRDNDGILGIVNGQTEDSGLDGLVNSQEGDVIPAIAGRPGRGSSDPAGDDFDLGDDNQDRLDRGEFMYVNGTEGNERLDSEDIDRDGVLDLEDGFFRVSLDLDDPNPLVDIYRDFTGENFQDDSRYVNFVNEALDERRTWRRYRLDLREAIKLLRGDDAPTETLPSVYFPREPDLSRIRTLRIWYEPDGSDNPDEPNTRRIRLADMRFLGNRWIADGVRDRYDAVLDTSERGNQDFSLGVLNNKDNAATYVPPIEVERRNSQDELEQSLQLVYEVDSGNGFRAFRDLPGRSGENYLNYDELNFYWRVPYAEGNDVPDPEQQRLEGFYWVGSDSLNYYEISVPFDRVPPERRLSGDWIEVNVRLADLSNVRTAGFEDSLVTEPDDPTRDNPLVTRGTVVDPRNGSVYDVTVRGRPDLERVTRYYVGLRAPTAPPGVTYRGEVLFNELRLRGVNRRIGYAQRYAVNAQIPGVADLQLDYQNTDEEFRGLNRDLGTGINSTRWNARVSTKIQNWIPLGGIDLPITLQRSTDLDLPKYEPRSDRELTDPAEKDEFRSESTTERFSLQFRKPRPSENPLLQYTLDRFTYSINGTRFERFSPTQEAEGKSADQRYSYDLQLRKAPAIPVPFTGLRLGVIPQQVQVTSSWRYNESQAVQKSLDTGTRVPQPAQVTKGNTNQLQVTMAPLNDLSATMNFNSGRNQLLPGGTELFGIDFGVEETFSQTLGMQFKPNFRWLNWAQPTINYSGGYNENRRPSIGLQMNSAESNSPIADELDPDGDGRKGVAGEVRNVTNRADLNVRSKFDVKDFLDFATGPFTSVGRWAGGLWPGGSEEGSGPEATPPTEEPATQGMRGPSAGVALAQSAPSLPPRREDVEDDEDDDGASAADDSTAADQGPLLFRLDYAELLKSTGTPFVNVWKNLQPFNATWQQQRNSTFNQIGGRPDLLYRFGFSNEPDFGAFAGVPNSRVAESGGGVLEVVEQDFVSTSETRNRTFSVSAQSKLSSKVSIDASYRRTGNEREGAGGATQSSTLEWPNVNVRVQGVGDWGIWDSIGDPFQSSNLDVSYKRNEARPSAPRDTPLPPRVSTTIQPRWNMRLRSGLDMNLGVTITSDQSSSLQSRQFNDSVRVNLTFRQNFDADGRLKFLRFGRTGTGTTIDMNVNASFSTNSSYRETDSIDQLTGEVTTERDQEQGRRTLSIRPQFSYQFSRNLRASLELNFSRREVTNTEAVDTTVGIFFDATLNF